MEKIGYILLISVYLLIFPLSSGLHERFDDSLSKSTPQESLVEKIASDVSKAIGMESFFNSLSRGI